ncbi:MAG: fumarylacetoacetase [Gemmatimonadaceae bacterium]
MPTNLTHDPSLPCWVESANVPGCDFPIQNLPFCVFSEFDEDAVPRGGIAIGDQILDLAVCADESLFGGRAADAVYVAAQSTLNELMSVDPENLSALRAEVSALLSGDGHTHRGIKLPRNLLRPMDGAVIYMPANIGNYTDFYASIFHATNVGSMFRPDNPLLPNYKWVPIGYHGRASSVSLKETVVRPHGQTKRPSDAAPTFGPSQQLDYELELGAFIARGNAMGDQIPIGDASESLFGFCLVNDWSARDIQSWEYQPLGPFLSKSFATNISPFIVTSEALAPFRSPAYARPEGDPAPLDYLLDETDQAEGAIDIQLEVYLSSEQMRDENIAPVKLSAGKFRDMYWTMAQMVAHHTSNGCDLRPGDLIASGTVSGPDAGQRGCLLEITRRGTEPLTLPTGEQRQFLEDGDEVILRGYCEREGFVRIGFGECRAMIVAEES